MAPVILGTPTTVASNSASQLAVPVPVGAAAGELLFEAEIFRQSAADSTSAPLTPAGWTRNDPFLANNGQLASFRRSAAGGEPASYQFASGQFANRAAALMFRVGGVDLTSPIDAAPSFVNNSLAAQSITTLAADTLLLYVMVTHIGSLVTVGSAVPGMTLVAQVQCGSSAISYLAVHAQSLAAAGGTGTRTAVLSSGGVTPTSSSSFMLAIRPTPVFGVPSGFEVAPSGTGLGLEWDDTAQASGYDVERDGVVIAQDVPVSSYQDNAVTAGSTHGYRVRAVQ